MNGDREAMSESANEPEEQPDPNKLNNQSGTNEAKSTDCFTNGTSCQNSPTRYNQEDIVPRRHNEDTNDDNNVLEHNKTTTNTDNPEPDNLQDKVSNGEDTTDVLMDSDLEVNDSKDTSSINDKDLEDIESLVNDSKDSQETLSNEIKDGIFISKERDNVNGLESSQDSEDDMYKYVDDAEDPISSGEPKEEDQDVLHKLNSKESETGTFKIVTINRYHSDDENSSDCSDSEGEPRAEDVSFTSGGDDSRDNNRLKTSDVIILENEQMDSRNGTQTPEVHEICSDNSDKDDCVVTAIETVVKTPRKRKVVKTVTPSSELRRSSRAIKRKKYDDTIEDLDAESDLEEVVLQDPLQSKSRAAINTSKSIATFTSKIKNKLVQKKDDKILIIGSSTITKSHTPLAIKSAKINQSTLSENIYQKITARGTSVTPISVKSIETKNMATQATQATFEPILPTLTDDMYVVEAPSFIVPYVYEKPAAMPFKEFVEKWGKEIEEQKTKAEQELQEKKKAEKAKREQERQEKKERGEEVHESEEDELDEVKKKKAEKAERKERRRKKKEDDDASWDGSSSEESDDESISDDDSQTKDNIGTDLKNAAAPQKTDSYFDLRLGKFFMDIGTNLVQQYVQTDLLHQQNKKLQREKKVGHSTKSRQVSIALLTKNLELSQKTNASYTFKQKKCKFCTFKTESELALQHHLEIPHMKNNNVYICNFCSMEFTGSPNVLYHMDMVHGVKGRLERAPVLHQCANCPFEDHGKGKLARHLIACAKRFKTETNLAPPVEWEHPAKIPKLTRARAPVPYQAAQFARHPTDGAMSNVRIPIGNALTSPTFRPRLVAPSMRPTGLLIRHANPPPSNFNVNVNAKKPSNHAILISPSPRLASPIQPLNATNAKGVVMCEICDGYIKDLEQLRNHMQWIHKVKIHPKMIYNRPPLNCQKCQFRFFTDQGLERHLLGSHGLVTSAIQEAANKGKDAGRCPVCGRAYQRKLLAHVSRDHNLVLKPAHLSYKCTVCTATFGMYRQFENHVYSAHSVVAKKVIDKKVAAPAKGNANDNAAKQLKANEDITIIPQPVKIGAAK